MARLIRFTGVTLFLFLITVLPAFQSVTVQTASAQYTPATGFELAWSLDPRSDAVLFPRGPAFGARSVWTGMDFDNDGNLEILFTTDETLAPGGPDPGFMELFLYENNGDNSYEYVWHYTHTDASNSLSPAAYGDIDQDGLWEIYFGVPTINGDDKDLFVFEQNEDLTFPTVPTNIWGFDRDGANDFRPSGFVLADVDGDGKIELVTTSRTGGNRELVVASLVGDMDAFASWNIELEVGEDILGGGGIYDVDVADFDDDGLMEIWVNTWNGFSLTIYEATGTDTYALQTDINAYIPDGDPGSFNSHSFLFADIDSDGRDELIYPLTDGIYYFLDDVADVSTITGASFDRVGRFGPGTARGGDVGDVDGDGNLDIIVGTGTFETIVRIEHDGVGDPADSTSYSWTTILDSSSDGLSDRYYPLSIADVDLDGDQKREIVLTNLFASDVGQPIILILESVGTVAVEPIDSELPQNMTLKQNYPNPFSGRTTIEYAVDQAGAVKITVYNILGQAVRTLVDETHQPGNYRTDWDGLNEAGQRVSVGSYIYAIEANGGRQSRNLAVIR